MKIDEFAKKSEEESSKEPKDCKRFVYYETDTLKNLFGSQEASPPKSPKSPKSTNLQPVQLKLQSKGPESQSRATKLFLEKTKSDGLESYIVGPKIDIEDHKRLVE